LGEASPLLAASVADPQQRLKTSCPSSCAVQGYQVDCYVQTGCTFNQAACHRLYPPFGSGSGEDAVPDVKEFIGAYEEYRYLMDGGRGYASG
jgi:hypothetical protein